MIDLVQHWFVQHKIIAKDDCSCCWSRIAPDQWSCDWSHTAQDEWSCDWSRTAQDHWNCNRYHTAQYEWCCDWSRTAQDQWSSAIIRWSGIFTRNILSCRVSIDDWRAGRHQSMHRLIYRAFFGQISLQGKNWRWCALLNIRRISMHHLGCWAFCSNDLTLVCLFDHQQGIITLLTWAVECLE